MTLGSVGTCAIFGPRTRSGGEPPTISPRSYTGGRSASTPSPPGTISGGGSHTPAISGGGFPGRFRTKWARLLACGEVQRLLVVPPVILHLVRRLSRQLRAGQSRHQMQAHVDAGRDAGGSDDRSEIDPAPAFDDIHVGKQATQLGQIFPMGCRLLSLQQAGLPQEKGPGAHRGGHGGRRGHPLKPGHHLRTLHLGVDDSAGDDEDIQRRVILQPKPRLDVQSSARHDRGEAPTDGRHDEDRRAGRFAAAVDAGRRREDLERAGEIQHFDGIEKVDAYGPGHARPPAPPPSYSSRASGEKAPPSRRPRRRRGGRRGCGPSYRSIVSRVMRLASRIGTVVMAMTNKATTLVTGRWRGLVSWLNIQIGSVSCWPAVKVVTMISSKDRAKASTAPATIAVARCGRTMWRKVWNELAPRSIEASICDEPMRRKRARTLL